MNLYLKTAFLEKGIRQIEAANALKLDPAKLSKIVNGWLEPKPEERKAIADFLGKPENEIFPKKDDSPKCCQVGSISGLRGGDE